MVKKLQLFAIFIGILAAASVFAQDQPPQQNDDNGGNLSPPTASAPTAGLDQQMSDGQSAYSYDKSVQPEPPLIQDPVPASPAYNLQNQPSDN